MEFCGCCDDEAPIYFKELSELSNDEKIVRIQSDLKEVEPWVRDGMVDILTEVYKGEKLKVLEEKCKDFLSMDGDDAFKGIKGYITIWSFAYDYMELPANTYAYFLLCDLEDSGLMEHGAGIRCGWKTFGDHDVSPESHESILEWAHTNPT